MNHLKLSYRRAVKEDTDLLIGLYNQSFYEDFVRYGECPAYGKTKKQMQRSMETFPKDIIFCGDTPAGVISVNNKGCGEYYVGCLCVIPEYQKQGIGTQAMTHFLETCPDWKRISLITPRDKDGNIYFYTQKCGFRISGTEMDGNVKVVRLVLDRR